MGITSLGRIGRLRLRQLATLLGGALTAEAKSVFVQASQPSGRIAECCLGSNEHQEDPQILGGQLGAGWDHDGRCETLQVDFVNLRSAGSD
jgi:hypothetical protein